MLWINDMCAFSIFQSRNKSINAILTGQMDAHMSHAFTIPYKMHINIEIILLKSTLKNVYIYQQF